MHSRRLAALALALAACGDDTNTTAATGSTSGLPGTTTVTTFTSTGEPTSGEPTSTTNTSGVSGTTTTTATTDEPATTDPSTSSPVSTTGTTDEPMTSSSTSAGSSTGEPVCPEDTIVCNGDTAQVCDGAGGFKSEEACQNVCIPDVGCKLCLPGALSCDGDKVMQCNDTGDGMDLVETCDGLLGLTCDPQTGACAGACADLGLSYIGCDYYPTVLQQYEGYNDAPANEFAVAVANTSGQMASVTITRGANTVTTSMVAPGDVKVIPLPWVNELTKGTGPSVLVADGAYRLRSTTPVTVYQYNPIKATVTNDASLLLPVNTWTGNYLVASWQFWNAFGGRPGLYAVVAAKDNTTVKLTPSATGKIVQAGGGVAADGTGQVVLNEGDVLEVLSANGGDLTGTIVAADKPVQVFGGHECSNVPINITACDHLEESMFPIETLAKEYVVVPPVQVPNDALDKAQVVRVIASEDNTTLTFNPDQPVNKNLAKAGDFVEMLTTTAKFVVTADKKILVSQYMVGQSGGYGTSDPAMLLAVNPMQWRKNYLFHAAPSWSANYVDIIAPKNAAVTVDGAAVGAWQPIGASNYQVAHVKLSNAGNGNHTVGSDVGVGIGVYGVLNFGSYWYPGGLDLDVIPQ